MGHLADYLSHHVLAKEAQDWSQGYAGWLAAFTAARKKKKPSPPPDPSTTLKLEDPITPDRLEYQRQRFLEDKTKPWNDLGVFELFSRWMNDRPLIGAGRANQGVTLSHTKRTLASPIPQPAVNVAMSDKARTDLAKTDKPLSRTAVTVGARAGIDLGAPDKTK